MPIYKYILIAFILVLSQDYAVSQDNQTEEIEEVIVIGSRLSDKNINNLLPVTYIDSETIDLLGIDSGDELLRSIIQQGTNKFNDAGNAIAGVNSARGDMIDDDAMVESLKNNKIFALGLDVYNGEPNIHPGYLKLPNVFILPHLGSATKETRTAMANLAIDNIQEFFKTGTCTNKIN